MGNLHTVTIYDDEYMKIDNVFYAYKFRNLMHYGLTLNVMGDIKSVNGYEKVWGASRLCYFSEQSRYNYQLYLLQRYVPFKKFFKYV